MFCVIVKENHHATLYKDGKMIAELSASIKKGSYYYDSTLGVVYYDFMGHLDRPKKDIAFPKWELMKIEDGKYPIIYNYEKTSNSYRGDDGMELGESSRSHTVAGFPSKFTKFEGNHVKVSGGIASIEGNVFPVQNWLKNICSQF